MYTVNRSLPALRCKPADMNQAITLPNASYTTRLLGPPDLASLQSLFDRCLDYFEIATGSGAHPDEAQRAFVAGPPSKEVSDKRIVGVFQDDVLVGVLDALKDWPEDGVWTMGMLLIDPAHRGNGLGTRVLDAYEAWCGSQESRTFRTAVVAHHDRGARFLEGCGYHREGALDNYAAGSRVATIQFFEKHT